MSNKQVVAIFILGIALLLAAFWAGLFIVKQDAPAGASHSSNAAPSANAAGAQAAKPTVNANLTTQPVSATNEEARYMVLIGKYGTLDQAKQIQAEIRRDYLAAFVQMPSGDNTLYTVAIGPYSKREADQVAADLSNKRRGIMIQPYTQN
ncbi:MAG: SPOR domain-containing protein [Blastocatellia bacterium]